MGELCVQPFSVPGPMYTRAVPAAGYLVRMDHDILLDFGPRTLMVEGQVAKPHVLGVGAST